MRRHDDRIANTGTLVAYTSGIRIRYYRWPAAADAELGLMPVNVRRSGSALRTRDSRLPALSGRTYSAWRLWLSQKKRAYF